jgi:hypothetical protein
MKEEDEANPLCVYVRMRVYACMPVIISEKVVKLRKLCHPARHRAIRDI